MQVGDHPLAPRNPDAMSQKTAILSELHEDFMAKVVAGRGDKLKHEAAAAYQRAVKGEAEVRIGKERSDELRRRSC